MNNLKKLAVIAGLATFIITFIFTSCCEVINVGNVGLKFRKAGGAKGVSDMEYVSGWAFYNPFTERIIEFTTRTRSVSMEQFPVTALGGSTFDAHPNYIYNVNAVKADTTYRAFGTNDLEAIEKGFLTTIVVKALGDVANKYPPDSLLSAREKYEHQVALQVQRDAAPYGFNITVFRANLTPPKALADAINAKQKAVQDAQTIENEKLSIIAQGQKDIAKAKADSTAAVIAAKAEAEVIRVKQEQLQRSPAYIDLIKAERWNGALPQIITGNGGNLFMQIPNK